MEGCVVIHTDSMYANFIVRHTSILYPISCPHSSKHIRCDRCSCLQNVSFRYVAVCSQSCYIHQILNAPRKKKSYGVIAGDIGGWGGGGG